MYPTSGNCSIWSPNKRSDSWSKTITPFCRNKDDRDIKYTVRNMPTWFHLNITKYVYTITHDILSHITIVIDECWIDSYRINHVGSKLGTSIVSHIIQKQINQVVIDMVGHQIRKKHKLTFFTSSMSLPDFLIIEQILACA